MNEPQIVINKPWNVHIEEQERKRKAAKNFLFGFFIFIIICAFFSLPVYVGLILLVIFLICYWKRIFRRKKKKGWERIRELPNWAYNKMKKRRKNIVNGDHYIYKREGNKFYRKKK
jgi:hypothetical protein